MEQRWLNQGVNCSTGVLKLMSETPQTKVHMVVANSGVHGEKEFDAGTTLRGALETLKLGAGETMQVKVNRKAANLDQVLQPGDRVSIAPRNMKAA
jgi:sulfur carrier protein ThiS